MVIVSHDEDVDSFEVALVETFAVGVVVSAVLGLADSPMIRGGMEPVVKRKRSSKSKVKA